MAGLSGFASASLFFKTFRIHRAIDAEKNVLAYTVISTKLINGSPFNSTRANPEKVKSALAATRSGLIQAVCWLGGQQRWASPTRMT